MPVFRVTVEKFVPSSNMFFSNVYHINAGTLAEGANQLTAFATAERPIFVPGVTVAKSRIDDRTPNTDNFITFSHNLAGTKAIPAGAEQAPWWVVSRVDFMTGVPGRPSRKYLRGTLFEADFTMIALSAGQLTLLNNYAAAILAIPGICDVDGQALTAFAVFNSPAMRQLRRGSKKKPIP